MVFSTDFKPKERKILKTYKLNIMLSARISMKRSAKLLRENAELTDVAAIGEIRNLAIANIEKDLIVCALHAGPTFMKIAAKKCVRGIQLK
jgi:hypothetical protein